MNAVEKIEAAITKLEALKAGGAASWYARPNDIIGGTCIMPVDATPANAPVGIHPIADFVHAEDAALIVTLHRSIDAQLAILRDGLVQAKSEQAYPHYWYAPPKDGTLTLADAILGGDS